MDYSAMIEQAPFQQPINGVLSPNWVQWFSKIGLFAGSVSDHGTTANRPTKNLYIGRFYFDDTLGIPIWLKTVDPADWVDATGASV